MQQLLPRLFLLLACAALAAAAPAQEAQDEAPLPVYILMGQSNMVGFGRIEPVEQQGTLQHLVEKEERCPELVAEDGSWAARDDVWLVQVTVQQRQGWLQPVGRQRKGHPRIGPV